jgi:hypothetical protein
MIVFQGGDDRRGYRNTCKMPLGSNSNEGGWCVFSGDTCEMLGLVNPSFMSNVLGLPPLVVLLQSSFWTGSVKMGMGTSSGLKLSF